MSTRAAVDARLSQLETAALLLGTMLNAVLQEEITDRAAGHHLRAGAGASAEASPGSRSRVYGHIRRTAQASTRIDLVITDPCCAPTVVAIHVALFARDDDHAGSGRPTPDKIRLS